MTLIFTSGFLHKTANQRLVFQAYTFIFFLFFFLLFFYFLFFIYFLTERNKDQADGGEEFFSTSLIAESSWNNLTNSSLESGLW